MAPAPSSRAALLTLAALCGALCVGMASPPRSPTPVDGTTEESGTPDPLETAVRSYLRKVAAQTGFGLSIALVDASRDFAVAARVVVDSVGI